MAGLLDSLAGGVGTLNQAIGQTMNSPLGALGLGLMGAAQPYANPAEQIQGAFGRQQQQQQGASQTALNRQQLGMNQLQMKMFQAQMPVLMEALHNMGGLMGDPTPGQQAPAGAAPTVAGATQGTPPSVGMPPATMPASAPPSAAGGTPDPWALYRSGVGLSAFPMTKDLGAAQLKYADALLQNDPRFVTQTAVAKDQITQDQALLARAQRTGDPVQINGAYTKLLKDTGQLNIASNSGNVTTTGGLTAAGLGINTVSPTQGVQTQGGVESAIPGAAQARAQIAGATTGAQSAAELAPIFDAGGNQIGFAPRGSAARAQATPPPNRAPQNTAPAAPVRSGMNFGLGPAAHAQLATTGEESGKYLATLQTQADNATQTNYALDQMSTSAKNVNLGPGAPARQWVENAIGSLGQQFGIAPPKELASYEELQKYGNQIAFAATRQLGSREAAQIVELQLKSNPNAALVPEAFDGLVQSMRAVNSYTIAKNTAIQGVATDQASAIKAASAWTSKIDPRVWDLSLGPQLAQRFAGQIGVGKIATALPVMASDDALRVMRNLAPTMQGQVLSKLPAAAKQELLRSLQSGGASGAW